MLSVILRGTPIMQIISRLVCWFGLLTVLLTLVQGAGAREAFVIHGLLIQSQAGGRIPQVAIRDIRSRAVAMSDELGGISIKVTVGDTLQFAKTGFAVTKIVVVSQADLLVTMQAEIALKEVSIKEKSVARDQQELVNNYREKGLYFDGSPPLLLFNPISGSPLTGLHELLGKDAANERRYLHFARNEQQEAYIDKRFTSSLVKSITNLQDTELPAFMDNCRPRYDDLTTWSDYQLQLYIRAAFAKWQADKSTQPAE
jgi:hypothetical protein